MTKKKSTHVLRGSRCYLIGHMEYLDGHSWREVIKTKLKPCGINFFDPYYKPFVQDIPEDEKARGELKNWMETEQYDLVQQRMWSVRSYDLRLCDICDFFMAHIIPKVLLGEVPRNNYCDKREKTTVLIRRRGQKKYSIVVDGRGSS